MGLFEILKGKLRPGYTVSDRGDLDETAKTTSGRSTLHVHYNGPVGTTVLSKANLKRIHNFLIEPQKNLNKVNCNHLGALIYLVIDLLPDDRNSIFVCSVVHTSNKVDPISHQNRTNAYSNEPLIMILGVEGHHRHKERSRRFLP